MRKQQCSNTTSSNGNEICYSGRFPFIYIWFFGEHVKNQHLNVEMIGEMND